MTPTDKILDRFQKHENSVRVILSNPIDKDDLDKEERLLRVAVQKYVDEGLNIGLTIEDLLSNGRFSYTHQLHMLIVTDMIYELKADQATRQAESYEDGGDIPVDERPDFSGKFPEGYKHNDRDLSNQYPEDAEQIEVLQGLYDQAMIKIREGKKVDLKHFKSSQKTFKSKKEELKKKIKADRMKLQTELQS